MKCIYSLLFLSTFVSCSLLEKEEIDNSICPDGDCWVKLYTDFEEDSNGYHHVTPQWFSETSGRFDLLIESSPTIGRCQYNGMTVVSSKFDSDTYWEVVTLKYPWENHRILSFQQHSTIRSRRKTKVWGLPCFGHYGKVMNRTPSPLHIS